jgi:hypothetical protein
VYIGDNSETFLELAEPERALKRDGKGLPTLCSISLGRAFRYGVLAPSNCEVWQLQEERHEHRPEA